MPSPENYDGVVAVGYFTLRPTYGSDGDNPDSIARARAETLEDRIDTLSRGFLGLTVACARCHNHKFDPIPIQDFYSLASVFNNTTNEDETELVTTSAARQQFEQHRAELARLQEAEPPMYVVAHSLVDSGDEDMGIAIHGNLRNPEEVAPHRFLSILAGSDTPRFTKESGRLELAEAIVSPDNPLTARMVVNRIWQHHFGHGIVGTPSNFGALGERPTHLMLLDWLADRFIHSG